MDTHTSYINGIRVVLLLSWNLYMCVLQMTYVDFCRAILCVFITVVIQCSFLFPYDFYVYLLTFFLRYLNINIDKFGKVCGISLNVLLTK